MVRLALISNINMDPIAQKLQEKYEVYIPVGYANVLEEIYDYNSGIYLFLPEICFFFFDIEQAIACSETKDAVIKIYDSWLNALDFFKIDGCTCYVNDADFRTEAAELFVEKDACFLLEQYWNNGIIRLVTGREDFWRFPYSSCVKNVGKKAFYIDKLWYMGRIIHSSDGRARIIDEIDFLIEQRFRRSTKKVLLLDLDNTLWGGICGEENIVLSDEKGGLIYKELQEVIVKIKNTGVLLGIVSKNNEEDAMKVIQENRHMILKENDFVISRINWKSKPENIADIAKELNIGLDAIVFFDDSSYERQSVKELLPEVTVPDFPDRKEELAKRMIEIYHQYFQKMSYTKEDLCKTQQYRENEKRENYRKTIGSFDDYLKNLHIVIHREDAWKNRERIFQLINKTNQFNLTTVRYSKKEIDNMIQDTRFDVLVYSVSDCFGENGITAIAILDYDQTSIDSFLLSCRIMGRKIENAILDDIENKFIKQGIHKVYASYIPTKKNKPVADFYEKNGYIITEKSEVKIQYEYLLDNKQAKEYYAEWEEEK